LSLTAYAKSYNRALKFAKSQPHNDTEVARQGFEQKIDENPLDPLNHHVYSDWLRDQGQENEADFRKSMGDWLSNRPPHLPIKWSDKYHSPWRALENDLPEGVNDADITKWNNYQIEQNPDPKRFRYYPEEDDNFPVDRTEAFAQNHDTTRGWRTYRDMEQAFRRAFMANRQASG
jgi:uncharacterized protein (TIGR02996 family)